MSIEHLESDNIIFEAVCGSKAYGLDTPTSDTDIRGVFISPKTDFYAMDFPDQLANDSNDIVYYELSKFIHLLQKNNPNVLELLAVPEECIRY